MLDTDKRYKDKGGVYLIRCDVNNFVYVGQTKNFNRRFREHINSLNRGIHRNKRLQDDYDKYGCEFFYFDIISYNVDNMDEVESNEIDKARYECRCYNVFSGGTVGKRADQSFRDKISQAHSGRIVSEETKKKKSLATKRQWENQEYRAKMVESAKHQWTDDEYRNKMHEAHAGKSEACRHILLASDIPEIRKLHADGMSVQDIANIYNVSKYTIRGVLNKTRWVNY